MKECHVKYDAEVYAMFCAVFKWLPDILWSDPHTVNGWKENSRGAGMSFCINYGPDHVYKYMVKNRLELIIRSHECVPNGFDWPFGAKGLFQVIVTHRDELRRRFQELDPGDTHTVATSDWDDVMQQQLQIQLNWASIRPLLTSIEPNQTIDYVNFLDRYHTRGTTASQDDAAASTVAGAAVSR
ncbi:hypothetical protein DYB30_000538 [Aphanomyces astaci]|nr:hypothetical protein DYB36_006883 [Aphanomyces astaci]RHY61176.1 hypothetical protein DYB34_003000 [Aphanomyces astaci]RHY71937.1 hypothetical protein DYB30_000538 [Aphanomyces astaci]